MEQPVHHGLPGRMLFHPGMPDSEYFPFAAWSCLLARRASFAGERLFGTYHVAGHPDLRAAIAAYLKAARGVGHARSNCHHNGRSSRAEFAGPIADRPRRRGLGGGARMLRAESAFVAAGADRLPLHVDETG